MTWLRTSSGAANCRGKDPDANHPPRTPAKVVARADGGQPKQYPMRIMYIFVMRSVWIARSVKNHRQAIFALVLYVIAQMAFAAHAGEHPLIAATKRGDLTSVATLLDNGTDPNARDASSNTALIFAARDGHRDIAAVLIDHGAAINWRDDESVTPLIIGSFKGHIEIVRLLLKHGARLDLRDKWGRTALTYALKRGGDDAIARLLRSAD